MSSSGAKYCLCMISFILASYPMRYTVLCDHESDHPCDDSLFLWGRGEGWLSVLLEESPSCLLSHLNIQLSQWFSNGAILLLKGHLSLSGDIFGYHN